MFIIKGIASGTPQKRKSINRKDRKVPIAIGVTQRAQSVIYQTLNFASFAFIYPPELSLNDETFT
jgi:hypothetical protein